jgi:hypothetical protein
MVVQDKKTTGEIRICVDLRKLNDASIHDPFPTPFIDEILDNVGGQEVYFKMFTDHSTLKYLVNKPVLGGKISRWLLLF